MQSASGIILVVIYAPHLDFASVAESALWLRCIDAPSPGRIARSNSRFPGSATSRTLSLAVGVTLERSGAE